MRSTRHTHPAVEELEGFLRGEDGLSEAKEHLEAGCLRCVTAASEAMRSGAAVREGVRSWIRGLYGEQGAAGRAAVSREIGRGIEAISRIVAYEEAVGPALLQRLLGRQAQARRTAIRGRRQNQTLGFARFLTSAARGEVFQDVERAVELGELAVEVAELLEEAGYGRGVANDARALAWGALANSQRVASDLPLAERTLRQARLVAREGSGDPMVEGELLSLEGSLRVSQARFKEARQVLEVAAALFRRHGEQEREARVLTQMAKALGDGGDAEQAVVVLERVEELLARYKGGPRYLQLQHSRAAYLNESGRTGEARELLERIRPQWRRHMRAFGDRQRLQWLEARICLSEGATGAAEENFLAVRRGWEEQDEAYELALVSLELAVVYLNEGRMREVKSLAEAMLPVFRAQEVHHHALAALALVHRAVEAESATASLFEDVIRYLRQARHNPSLPYPGLV